MTCTAILTVVIVAFGPVAYAQSSRHADLATADALYDEGRQLVAEERFTEACARFEASMTIVQRLGVELNVAECYERLGKIASAWVAYSEAAALARRTADAREGFAWERHKALELRLSRLVITLDPGASDADLVVKRDGVEVPRSVYGVGIPVDPGEHTVAAEEPGRVAWSTRLSVAREGEIVRVTIPELARASVGRNDPTPRRRQPTLATWMIAGTGAASVAAGAVLGLSARSLSRQARPECDSSNACTGTALALIERSRHYGNLSSAAFIIGGAALVTSTLLYLGSPRAREGRVRVSPALSPHAVALTISGGL